MTAPMAEREQRWTIWLSAALGRPVAVGDRPAGRFVRGVEVVPAARLAEVDERRRQEHMLLREEIRAHAAVRHERDALEFERDELGDELAEERRAAAAARADLARAREALEEIRRIYEDSSLTNAEAQDRTAEVVDEALAAIKTREDGGGAMPDGTDTHPINEHGTTRCPNNGGIAAYVDEGECSSCGETVALAAPADREDGA